MASAGGETNAMQQDIQRLTDQIRGHCRKIPVAKDEFPQLAAQCDNLITRLNERSLIPTALGFQDIKSNLVRTEQQLAEWSRVNYFTALMRKKQIESGVVELVKELKSVIVKCPVVPPTPVLPPIVVHVADPPDRSDTEGPSQGGGAVEEVSRVAPESPQQLRFDEPLPHRPTYLEPEGQSTEPEEAPPVKRLDGEVTRLEEIAFAGGTYCEVWVGHWKKEGKEKGSGEAGGEGPTVEKVALKALKAPKKQDRARKRLEEVLPGWAELHHQNILPFYGIVTDIGPRLYMVYPWHESGNLLTYVKGNPQANKISLLRGSAAGLSYLHSQPVVHGNVKCKNVLISPEGEPQVCDFGIARIMEDINENSISKTVSSGDVVRYAAPELVEHNNASATPYSDTYSFAMLILECITEEVPFANLTRDAAVIHARISKKQCPPRPAGQGRRQHVSDNLWELMGRCWLPEPSQRPSMEHVHNFFLNHAS